MIARPVEAELLLAERQTWRSWWLLFFFANFVNATKSVFQYEATEQCYETCGPPHLFIRPARLYPETLNLFSYMKLKNNLLSVLMNLKRLKVKVKITPEQTMKAQRGSRGIALLFLQPWR